MTEEKAHEFFARLSGLMYVLIYCEKVLFPCSNSNHCVLRSLVYLVMLKSAPGCLVLYGSALSYAWYHDVQVKYTPRRGVIFISPKEFQTTDMRRLLILEY